MKNKNITIGIASTIAAVGIGVAIYLIKRNQFQKAQEEIAVADAGYETAYDVLYPMSNYRRKKLY